MTSPAIRKPRMLEVLRIFVVLFLTSLVVAFLCTRKLQPSLEICPSSEPLQPTTGFEAWILEQQQRRWRIARACSRAGPQIKTKRIYNRMFTFNEEHRLLFCLQPKVGSSTWLDHFVSLEKSSTQKNLLKLGRVDKKKHLAPSHPDIFTLAKTSITVSMVRHPFERLISAYQDKILGSKGLPVWNQIRLLISSQFGDFSFPSFVKWHLSNSKKKNGDLCDRHSSVVPCPSNPHWAPLHNRCDYCSVAYSVIAKLETFEDDLRYIGVLANVTFNNAVRENNAKENTSSIALDYFKQLKNEEVIALYEFYEDDFLMFGYSYEEFIT